MRRFPKVTGEHTAAPATAGQRRPSRRTGTLTKRPLTSFHIPSTNPLKTTALIAAALIFLAPAALPQGSLTPQGPPAPTMKTLDQVEARIIVNASKTPGDAANTFIISAPGSYYFTGNITGEPGKHGISIKANDVTLDLNGFALI